MLIECFIASQNITVRTVEPDGRRIESGTWFPTGKLYAYTGWPHTLVLQPCHWRRAVSAPPKHITTTQALWFEATP